MSNKHILPPLQRQALLSMLADPERALTRADGFYCPANSPHPAFTGRTIKAMERDGLVKLDVPFCTTRVDFTDEGLAIATQMHEADQVQAGAA